MIRRAEFSTARESPFLLLKESVWIRQAKQLRKGFIEGDEDLEQQERLRVPHMERLHTCAPETWPLFLQGQFCNQGSYARNPKHVAKGVRVEWTGTLLVLESF